MAYTLEAYDYDFTAETVRDEEIEAEGKQIANDMFIDDEEDG